MYKPTDLLQNPKSSLQPLWRYLSFDRLADLLRSEELYFRNLRHLDDGMEGRLTNRSRHRLLEWFYSQSRDLSSASASVRSYEEHTEKFYVNCWHMNAQESYLMWKAYAGKGVAIQTTYERLTAAFDDFPGLVTGGVIQYLDFSRESSVVGNVFHHVVTKDMPYVDEREFRLVFWSVDPANSGVASDPLSVRVRVDLKMLIEQVVLGPSVKSVPLELDRLLQEKGIKSSPIGSRVLEQS